jgi:methyltransferase family protein
MKCKICETENKSCFSERLMGNYDIDYFYCNQCGFVQTEDPFWLDEAYSRPINLTDTGYMVRNLFYAKRLTVLLYLLFERHTKFLDYAGGYGVFVRLMRDIGFDFFWVDKFTQNLFSSGFEWDGSPGIGAITSFEAFEHFVNPMFEIESLLTISDTIIFSTEVLPDPLPKPKEWWYYGLDHGQHISFYSERTFKYIAEKYGLHYHRSGALHILTKKNIARWKLLVSRLTKFGLNRILEKRLQSKTWDDYHEMAKTEK